MAKTTKITCVAILTKSGLLFRGKKITYFQHNHLAEEILADCKDKTISNAGCEDAVCNGIRGYLDSDGKFLTREEASIVAKEAGQLPKSVEVPYSMKSLDIFTMAVIRQRE